MKKKIKNLKSILINFEKDIKNNYEKGKIKAPIHLSGNNEIPLIKFLIKLKKQLGFSSWRNHYHAILKGIPTKLIKKEIMMGKYGVKFQKI